MKMPKSKYNFESLMLFAFEKGVKVGESVSSTDYVEKLQIARQQFCQEMGFIYFTDDNASKPSKCSKAIGEEQKQNISLKDLRTVREMVRKDLSSDRLKMKEKILQDLDNAEKNFVEDALKEVERNGS